MVRAATLMTDDAGRLDVKSLDYDGLVSFVVDDLGEPEFKVVKLYKWLWKRGARGFDEMDDLGKSMRAKLHRKAYISFLEPALVLKSVDETRKFLWQLEDGLTIESVLIPDGDKVTLCMSSQVGCAMACTFCLTGDMGLKRHLKPSEIANQAMQIGRLMPAGQRITNIVMMGMGEPLHKLDNLCTALNVCLDDRALNFSHRKITVSTVGMVPQMAELAARLPVNLAVSINATTEEQRTGIMPITRKWSLAELVEACRTFPLPSGKRITFEYVMLRDYNDSLEDAARLWELLQGIPSKVNLIPYNENPDRDLRSPPDDRVHAFQSYFADRGLSCSVRSTRGLDISAACGQLGKAWDQAKDHGWLATARVQAGLAAPQAEA